MKQEKVQNCYRNVVEQNAPLFDYLEVAVVVSEELLRVFVENIGIEVLE